MMFKKGDKVKWINPKAIACNCEDCTSFKRYGGVIVKLANEDPLNLNRVGVSSPGNEYRGFLAIHDNEIQLMHNALQRLKIRYEKKKIKNQKTSTT